MQNRRLLMVATMMSLLATSAVASDEVLLHAAGSLRAALMEVSQGFEKSSHLKVQAKFGASGLLKDEIAGGAKAEVFASANMEHPQALAKANRSGPVVLFARNKLCALTRPGVDVMNDTLLDRMLDPQIKLATSTPKADPSGDYAFEVFRKAEAIRPNAQLALEKKSRQLTGGAASAVAPAGRSLYGWHIAEGRADIFLAYCTAARDAQKENADLQVIALPDALAVSADYGLTVMADASPGAYQFALFILSSEGQRILVGYGFSAPNLPN
ncbi:MAG: molybdate transport system substrate-binding protein [Bradyrhizobium sp.]|jgi:molybdenum ABC transporter molybdate-binding protein|nr:molybdate transport system substrate-binding protein [Bradyrhizobium sp.]